MVLRTCLTNPGLWGEEYYLYRLHRRENESFKESAANQGQIQLLRALARSGDGTVPPLVSVNSKLVFKNFCERIGVPASPAIAEFSRGRVVWITPERELPRRDLFLKLVDGSWESGLHGFSTHRSTVATAWRHPPILRSGTVPRCSTPMDR